MKELLRILNFFFLMLLRILNFHLIIIVVSFTWENMVTQYAISRTKFPNIDALPAHCPIESRIFFSLPRLDLFAKLYPEHRT